MSYLDGAITVTGCTSAAECTTTTGDVCCGSAGFAGTSVTITGACQAAPCPTGATSFQLCATSTECPTGDSCQAFPSNPYVQLTGSVCTPGDGGFPSGDAGGYTMDGGCYYYAGGSYCPGEGGTGFNHGDAGTTSTSDSSTSTATDGATGGD